MPRRSSTSTSITWRQVSPPQAPAFIASAPPSVPGMPAKNSAGPRPHFTHCRAIARRILRPRRVRVALEALEQAQAPASISRAAQPAVAHQEVAAEAHPQHRHLGRQLADERAEIGTSRGTKNRSAGPPGMPGSMLRHGHVAQHPCFKFRRDVARAELSLPPLMRQPPPRNGP